MSYKTQLFIQLALITYDFSDDPPGVATVEVDAEATLEVEDKETPLDPKEFCSCGSCAIMATKVESVCCKSFNYLQAGGKNTCIFDTI